MKGERGVSVSVCVCLCMCGIHYLTFKGIAATTTLPTVCFSDWFTQRLLPAAIAGFFNIPVTHRMQC